MLDVGNLTWSGIAATTPNTAVSNQVRNIGCESGSSSIYRLRPSCIHLCFICGSILSYLISEEAMAQGLVTVIPCYRV